MSGTSRIGGIVLCGGRSQRMGLAKGMLPFGPELMLQRIVRLLSEVVEPIVIVAANGQQLPNLSADIMVARDEREDRGPLEGLRVGLAAIAPHADAAYATSCDVPLLSRALVSRMIAELGEHDAAVPIDGEFYHPLAAVYRTQTVATIERLVADDQLRASKLFETLHTHCVPVEQLRGIDPELLALMNVNSPSEYAKALELAGVPIDSRVKAQLGL
ncbi:MAG: molybdenum cofactor guanylyltransferase [Pirellulaceae bacterium]